MLFNTINEWVSDCCLSENCLSSRPNGREQIPFRQDDGDALVEQHAYTCVTEMKRSEIKTTYGVASNWSASER
jgi:hypothetical protein